MICSRRSPTVASSGRFTIEGPPGARSLPRISKVVCDLVVFFLRDCEVASR